MNKIIRINDLRKIIFLKKYNFCLSLGRNLQDGICPILYRVRETNNSYILSVGVQNGTTLSEGSLAEPNKISNVLGLCPINSVYKSRSYRNKL